MVGYVRWQWSTRKKVRFLGERCLCNATRPQRYISRNFLPLRVLSSFFFKNITGLFPAFHCVP